MKGCRWFVPSCDRQQQPPWVPRAYLSNTGYVRVVVSVVTREGTTASSEGYVVEVDWQHATVVRWAYPDGQHLQEPIPQLAFWPNGDLFSPVSDLQVRGHDPEL